MLLAYATEVARNELISIFESASYEQADISTEAAFADFVGDENADLYELYGFVTSLNTSDSATLYKGIMDKLEMLG